MSQDQSNQGAEKPKPGLLQVALGGVAIFGVVAVVYIIAQASINPQSKSDLKSLARGEMAKLAILTEAGPAPATRFLDAQGKSVGLADFRGKVVVINTWATWCGPCVLEMPTLAKLATEYQGQPVEVIALSIDGPREADKAAAFIAKYPPLKLYRDPTLKFPYDLKPAAVGLPTTVIYGRDGVERARLAGGADWSGKDAKSVIDHVLAQ